MWRMFKNLHIETSFFAGLPGNTRQYIKNDYKFCKSWTIFFIVVSFKFEATYIIFAS